YLAPPPPRSPLFPYTPLFRSDEGDYGSPLSSVNTFLAGAAHDDGFGEEAGLDVEWHRPFHDLLRRAVEDGHGEHSIAAVTELLRSEEHTSELQSRERSEEHTS